MQIGMNLLLWTGEVTEEHYPLIARMKELGFDGVEIPFFAPDAGAAAKLKRELDNQGLASTAVTVCNADTNPVSPEAGIRAAALDHLKAAIDASQALGAEVLCGPYHSALGEFVGRPRNADEWKWGVETLRAAAEATEGSGVTLCVEYLNRFECYFLNCMADAREFVQAVDHPNLSTMWDTFHANIEEQDLTAAILDGADAIGHVHISANDRAVPGADHVAWTETFRALKRIGYDGWFTIEAFGSRLPDLAAATCIWRKMYEDEEDIARGGLDLIKLQWSLA